MPAGESKVLTARQSGFRSIQARYTQEWQSWEFNVQRGTECRRKVDMSTFVGAPGGQLTAAAGTEAPASERTRVAIKDRRGLGMIPANFLLRSTLRNSRE